MNPSTETQQVQSSLKALLKKRGYTYEFLAKELGVSLPTVKRTLSAPDMTFGRLTKICSTLGIQLHEFLEVSQTLDTDLNSFTPEQEKFFCANPSYLHYLLALHNTQKTPTDLEKVCSLTKRSTYKYLAKLSELGLIRVHPEDKVRVMVTGLIGWDENGPLGKIFSSKIIKSLAERALLRTSKNLYTELSGRRLTKKQYEAMKDELRTVTEKYRRISKMNVASRERSEWDAYLVMIVADTDNREFYPEICNLP